MIKSLDKVLQDPNMNIQALKALAENSFDSILITDATNRTKILYANKAFKKLTGYSPDEVLGKTPKILQGAATDKTVISRLAKALSAGGRFEGKAINYKKDGTPFLMHWRVVPVKLGKDTNAWLAIQRETFSV
jgi:PAS domain S-box-containing protein